MRQQIEGNDSRMEDAISQEYSISLESSESFPLYVLLYSIALRTMLVFKCGRGSSKLVHIASFIFDLFFYAYFVYIFAFVVNFFSRLAITFLGFLAMVLFQGSKLLNLAFLGFC